MLFRSLTLSDRIAVFNQGYIEQIGTPNEIYNFSKTEFVCNFIGDINPIGRELAEMLAKVDPSVNVNNKNYVRLERLHVNRQPDEGQLAVEGVVESREYYGLYIKYYIRLASQTVKVIEKNDGVCIYEEGQTVSVIFDPKDIMSYAPAEEEGK